jgi:hypothetical protein
MTVMVDRRCGARMVDAEQDAGDCVTRRHGMFIASASDISLSEEKRMPEKETLARARRARRSGKAASTQASEFVREEMHHIREGKHGARSAKQAIAIGLSKARRAGVRLKPPAKGETSENARHSAERAYEAGAHPQKRTRKRSEAVEAALQREGHSAASHRALATQAHRAAGERTAADRSTAARKAARTKGPSARVAAARKAAATRAKHSRRAAG